MREQLLDTNLFPDLAVVDVEACSLEENSWPIEIGWSFGDLRTGGFLIRPHAAWDMDRWSQASEELHGITMDDCWNYGLDPEEAAMQMKAQLNNLDLLSDGTVWDKEWIRKLFDDTGVEQTFRIWDYDAVLTHLASQIPEETYYRIEQAIGTIFPYTHRAADDARNRMAMLCVCRRPELLESWLANTALKPR